MAVTMLIIAPLLVITAPALFAHLPPWLNTWIRTPLELSIYYEWSDAIEIGIMHMELVYAPLEATVFGVLGAAIAIGAVQIIGLGMGMYFLRRFVDVSSLQMYGPPLVGAVVAGVVTVAVHTQLPPLRDVVLLATHGVLMGVTYLAVLVLLEGKELLTELRTVRQTLRQI